MLRTTRATRFFKSYSHLPNSNPLRRWVPHKFLLLFFSGIVATPFVSYAWTGASSAEPPESFAAYSVQLMMEMGPQSIMSRYIGYVAASELIPQAWHALAIRVLARVYSIDMEQFPPVDSYRTAQDFFRRRLRTPRALAADLPADCPAEAKARKQAAPPPRPEDVLFSPCDAEILQCGEVAPDRTILQVKGFSYPVDGLFRMSLPPLPAPEADLKRVYFVFHLRPGDYHRVHSPQAMKVHKTLHVPGLLLPTTHTAMRWLPNLIMSNERVLLFGEHAGNNGAQAAPEKKASSPPLMAMALVGATCVGSICLAFDERVQTNLADQPETSVLREYGRAAPTIPAGDEVGYFKWGSCVVLVADVPASSMPLAVGPGSEVRQGQRLL